MTLVLGGARSGKSTFAENLARVAEAAGRSIVYVATATDGDAEMAARIAEHQRRRPPHWRTAEAPLALAAALAEIARPDCLMLVDCLTLWLTNVLLAEPPILDAERARLLTALPTLSGDVVLVSNEVGMGLVAPEPLGRRFVDEAGRLHQAVAALADRVVLVVAGLPMALKGTL